MRCLLGLCATIVRCLCGVCAILVRLWCGVCAVLVGLWCGISDKATEVAKTPRKYRKKKSAGGLSGVGNSCFGCFEWRSMFVLRPAWLSSGTRVFEIRDTMCTESVHIVSRVSKTRVPDDNQAN